MVSKWRECKSMHANWNTVLESTFVFFHFPPTWKYLFFFCTFSLHLNFQRQFSTDFFSSSFSHTASAISIPIHRGCLGGNLWAGQWSATHLAVAGCGGAFSFLSTHWHLLALGSRDHPLINCSAAFSKIKSYFLFKSSIWLTQVSILQPISTSCDMASCTDVLLVTDCVTFSLNALKSVKLLWQNIIAFLAFFSSLGSASWFFFCIQRGPQSHYALQ